MLLASRYLSSSSSLTTSLWSLLFLVVVATAAAAGEEGEGGRCIDDDSLVYDYVVVGAGTAGSTAAANLANLLPGAEILLMDQGKDFSDEAIVMDNDEFSNIMETPYCQNAFTAEESLVSPGGWTSKRDIYACIPKILGGASSVNYGGWYRPPASDLDMWGEVSDGPELWSYDAMLPIFEQLENVDSSRQNLDDRFYDGVIPVKHENVSALYERIGIIDAVSQHFNMHNGVGDQNNNGRLQEGMNSLEVTRVENGCWYDTDGNELGCARNMRNGSSYNAFVRDPQRHGELSNLDVMQGAKVVKVDGIFIDDDDDNNNDDDLIEIHYVQTGYRRIVRARHEILLSAGSWGNPHIAMLSGIGNQTELTNAGIETKIDSPAVGRIRDHGVLWLRAILNQLPDMHATNTSATTPTIEREQTIITPRSSSSGGCMDTIAESMTCTMGGICDCETFVNAEESTGCGGVYTSQWVEIQINDLCPLYCDACPQEAIVAEEEEPAEPTPSNSDCEDTIAESMTCTMGGICDCETFVNAEESSGCGGVYTSQWAEIQINDLCPSYCDACPQNTGTMSTEEFEAIRGVDNPLPALLSDANAFNFYFKSDEALVYPDMEFLGGISPTGPNSGFFGLRIYQNKGTSGIDGGHMRVRSEDPYEDMDVTRGFYHHDNGSIEPMLRSLKMAISMIDSIQESHSAMMIEPNTFTVNVNDDEALKSYIRDNVVSEMHLTSSMRMGTTENGAVVDKYLKIIGSNGRVRVADTSIFPEDIRGHPMATAMAVGIKAAEIISADAPDEFKTAAEATTNDVAAEEGAAAVAATEADEEDSAAAALLSPTAGGLFSLTTVAALVVAALTIG